MTTYSDTAPIMMHQGGAEMGLGPIPVPTQEPMPGVDFSSTDLNLIHSKGQSSLILSIVSFIGCFFCSIFSVFCLIPAMLLAVKSRVSAEKKDYYESKLMLHWSYICTFAGCFIGGVVLAGIIILIILSAVIPAAVAASYSVANGY